MCTGCQFGHHPAIGLMHFLRGCDVAQQHTIAQHCRGSVIAGGFYAQDDYRLNVSWGWLCLHIVPGG